MNSPNPVPRPASNGAAQAAHSANRGPRPGPSPRPTNVQQSAQPSTPKASKLGAVISGPRRDPKMWLFYGDEGIGKSSLVADAPNPVFLDIEGRTMHLHVQRYPFRPDEGDAGTVPRTLAEVEEAIDDLIANAQKYSFKTVVFDGLSALESLIFGRIVDEAKARDQRNKEGKPIENIEDFGYQAGQKVAAQYWRTLVRRFEDLRFRGGVHVVLLGHSQILKWKNPNGDDFDCYRLRLDEKAAGVLLEKSDVVGFVTFDDRTQRIGRKAIGVAGERVIHLRRSTSWSAKCSLPMADVIDLASEAPWAPFDEALESLYSMSPDGLRAAIAAELERFAEALITADGRTVTAEAMRAATSRAGDDTSTLHRYLTGLRQSEPVTPETEQ